MVINDTENTLNGLLLWFLKPVTLFEVFKLHYNCWETCFD